MSGASDAPKTQSLRSLRGALTLVAAALLGLAVVALPSSDSGIASTALLPPVLAVLGALGTGRVTLSLLLAASLAAGLPLPRAQLPASAEPPGWAERFLTITVQNQADLWHFAALAFAMVLLGAVAVMRRSGGIDALVAVVRQRLSTPRSVKLGVSGAGLLLFFDDYANALLVGPAFRPLTDRFRVSRAKLAYLVDSTAAPVAGLALVSTWVGYEVGLIEGVSQGLGLSRGGYALLLEALPYRFYCVCSLLLVLLTSLLGRDFGPMLRAEREAVRTSSSVGASAALEDAVSLERAPAARRDWWLAAAPLALLVVLLPLGMVLDGAGLARWADPNLWTSFAQLRDALTAGENNTLVLLLASLATLLLALGLPLTVGRASLGRLLGAFVQGVRLSLGPLGILIAAWALASGCEALKTGEYLLWAVGGAVAPAWLPLATFLAAALMALLTGTSWGTMALLLPNVAPLAYQLGGEPLLVLTLGSVLDGAIFGDHCSPLSDTTVMSAVASDCPLPEHVRTQAPYALLAMLVAAACGYSPLARELGPGPAYLGAAALMAGVLVLIGRRPRPIPGATAP